jgi:hypothetical protein
LSRNCPAAAFWFGPITPNGCFKGHFQSEKIDLRVAYATVGAFGVEMFRNVVLIIANARVGA